MKIAVIIDTWFPAIGGGQINAYEISKRIANKNTQIDIVTRNNGRDNSKKMPFINVYKLGPKTSPDNIISKFTFLARAISFLVKKDYDLLHVHPFLPALILKPLSLIKGVPLIITVHGTRLFEKEKNTPARLLEEFILTGIIYDAQISVTKAFLKVPNINKKVIIIKNGVDLKLFKAIKTSKFTKKTVLWVGRYDPVKRVEDLIVAFQTLTKNIKKTQLILVGYGYQEVKIKKMVNNLNLKNVKFKHTKNAKELAIFYKKSHVFVLPSSSEGEPLTILEAQAASLPVIATNVGGTSEIVKNKKTGILVPPFDPVNLAQKIEEVLKDKNDFAQKRYDNLKKLRTWDQIAKMTQDLYKEVIHA